MTYPAEQTPDLLTVHEVAEQLRVDPSTVRHWIRQGSLQGVILPDESHKRPRYRVRRDTLEQLLGHDEQLDNTRKRDKTA